MPIELDGAAVLGSIAAHRSAFPDIVAEARKSARTLVLKQLKAKSTNLARLREIEGILGGEFALLLDGLSDAELKSLVKKFDGHHPELVGATGSWLRERLMALALGNAEPVAATKKTPAPRKQKISEQTQPERLRNTAASAVRKRYR